MQSKYLIIHGLWISECLLGLAQQFSSELLYYMTAPFLESCLAPLGLNYLLQADAFPDPGRLLLGIRLSQSNSESQCGALQHGRRR